jgi:hypothetical protein
MVNSLVDRLVIGLLGRLVIGLLGDAFAAWFVPD